MRSVPSGWGQDGAAVEARQQLGRLAREHEVTSNFFFQLNAETYNIFSDEVIDIMRELRTAGHCG